MPTALICGDPHGSFAHITEAARINTADVIFLLGDMDATRPLDEELKEVSSAAQAFWVHGNHDTDSDGAYRNTFNSALSENNLHGRVVTIAGLRVAGLGGVFRKKIWDGAHANYDSPEHYCRACGKGNLWNGGLPLRHRSSIFPSDFFRFQGMQADLLLSHEAPDLHPFGNPRITQLATDLGVRRAFHGHHHETIDYSGNVWSGVGLRGLHIIRW